MDTGCRRCGRLELGVRGVSLLRDDSERLWCCVSRKLWRTACEQLTMVTDGGVVCKVFGMRESG
jgi:hypothetical protein